MGSIVSRGRRAATSGGTADPAAGRAVAPRGSRRATWALGAVCALLAAGLFSWMSVGQWERWDSPSWDLAIFSQLAQDYAHLRAPIVDIKGHGFNLLGDHFHPLLILLGPVWALWPSGLAIMITQDALLGLGAGILAGFGTRFLGWARGLCLGTAFTLSFGVFEAVRVQFHEVAFAVPLLAMSLCLLALRRLRAAAGWAAPLVFVKEDLGITVAVIGLVILWTALRAPAADGHGAGPEPGSGSASEGSGEQRSASGIRPAPGLCSAAAHRVRGALRRPGAPTGIILACWGLAWSVLAVSVILPALNPHGTFDYADKVDVPRALGDPLQAFAQLRDAYVDSVLGQLEGGADAILVETCQDLLQAKAAILGAYRAMEQYGRRLPVICHVTVELTGTMLVGSEITAALTALEPVPDTAARIDGW